MNLYYGSDNQETKENLIENLPTPLKAIYRNINTSLNYLIEDDAILKIGNITYNLNLNSLYKEDTIVTQSVLSSSTKESEKSETIQNPLDESLKVDKDDSKLQDKLKKLCRNQKEFNLLTEQIKKKNKDKKLLLREVKKQILEKKRSNQLLNWDIIFFNYQNNNGKKKDKNSLKKCYENLLRETKK